MYISDQHDHFYTCWLPGYCATRALVLRVRSTGPLLLLLPQTTLCEPSQMCLWSYGLSFLQVRLFLEELSRLRIFLVMTFSSASGCVADDDATSSWLLGISGMLTWLCLLHGLDFSDLWKELVGPGLFDYIWSNNIILGIWFGVTRCFCLDHYFTQCLRVSCWFWPRPLGKLKQLPGEQFSWNSPPMRQLQQKRVFPPLSAATRLIAIVPRVFADECIRGIRNQCRFYCF